MFKNSDAWSSFSVHEDPAGNVLAVINRGQ